MAKLELPRVQHMTRKVGAPAIERISENRAPEMLQVHPDLMRASRAGTAFDQALAAQPMAMHAIFGDRFPAASGQGDSHLLAVHGIACDRRIDDAMHETAANPQPRPDKS